MKEFVLRITFYDDGTYNSDFDASEQLSEVEKVALASILRNTTDAALDVIEGDDICEDCKNCDETIIKQISVGENGEAIYVCPKCQTKFM